MKRMMDGIRWAFNFGVWNPTREEWLLACRCIQPEEKDRIHRFVFKRDAKAAMAGRLLLRKVIHKNLGIDYQDIRLDRSDKGKPFLTNELKEDCDSQPSFNVSHQGSYSVLAAETRYLVGVDVMRVEYVGGKAVSEFFHTMRRQFTQREWSSIREPQEEKDQLAQFYRHWCLKESYVKAVGIGIGFELQRLSFHTKTKNLQQGIVTTDTLLLVDGLEATDWMFEETLLDDDHCVCVALGKPQSEAGKFPLNPTLFQALEYHDLVDGAVAWNPEELSCWESFSRKDEQPGILRK